MTPVERAKADLNRLQKDLSRARATVLMLETQVSRVEAYIEMAPLYESDEAQGEATRARSNGIAATSVRLAVDMIKECGKRIHTRELLRLLQERGVTVGGSNPVANLSGFLSRSEELHNSRAEGWGLAGWIDPIEHPPSKAGETLQALDQDIPAPRSSRPVLQRPDKPRLKFSELNAEDVPNWEPPDTSDLDEEIPF